MQSKISLLEMQMHEQAPLLRPVTSQRLASIEEGVQNMMKIMAELKEIILGHHFESEAEEIHFFKTVKPRFIARLVYYHLVFQTESRKPQHSDKAVRKFFVEEQQRLSKFIRKHQAFLQYCRSNSSYLDHQFFLRDHLDIRLCPDSNCYVADHRFSTSHDFLLGKLQAYEQVHQYIDEALQQISSSQPLASISSKTVALEWTESKSALVELIYALHYHGAIKGSQAGIKELAHVFESLFKIDLGDLYRTFLDIRMRKTGRAKFLESLQVQLIKKMDEKDF